MWNKNTQDATKNLSRKYDYILGEVSAPDLYTKTPKSNTKHGSEMSNDVQWNDSLRKCTLEEMYSSLTPTN